MLNLMNSTNNHHARFSPPLESTPQGAPPVILVVDDNAIIRLTSKLVMKQEGYIVHEADSGEAALTVYTETRPDLILLDAMMPGLSGFEACQQLRTLPDSETVPILMITALNDEESVIRAFEAGATDYITKPVNTAVLRHRVRRMLHTRQIEQQRLALAKFTLESPLPVLRVLRNGEVIYANRAGDKLLEQQGHRVGDWVTKDWQTAINHAFETEQTQKLEVTYSRKTLSIDFVPVIDAGYVNLYAQDISALRASEQRYRALFERTNNGVFFLDAQHHFIDANQQLATMLGYSINDLKGKPCISVVSPLEQDRITRNLQRLLDGEYLPADECTFIKQDGSELVVSVSLAVAYDDAGSTLHIQGVVADITAQRRLAQMRTSLIATVSHELRTPLAAVMAGAETLLSEEPGPLSEEQLEFADIIYQGSQRLNQIVSSLFDITRIQERSLHLYFATIDLHQLLDQRHQELAVLAAEKDITLTFDLPKAPQLVLEADQLRLGQIIDNLLSNALKFTLSGGQITVTAQPCSGECLPNDHTNNGQGVHLRITDTGIGIPADDIPFLFERFHRAKNATQRVIPGAGLGLHLAHGLVKLHHGHLWVESKLDSGSTFHLWMPMTRLDTHRPPPPY